MHTVIAPSPGRARGRFASYSVSVPLLFCAGQALAADEPVADELDRIVVTANRVAQPLSRVGDSVTVIEANEARASQKSTVSDLLAMTPGVTVSRNGGLGTTTSLRIRGAEDHHTVVLIDGVKLNDPSSTGGGFNFGNLLATEYARIEVLRGPQSTLWGSQAIGGVVNIVTPLPQGPLSGSVSAEGGTHETAFVRARAEAGGERFGWRVAGDYLTTDGISAFDRDLGGVERDSYRNVGFNARAFYRITDNATAELRSTWNAGRTEFDGLAPPTFALADTPEYGRTDELVTYAGVNLSSFQGRFEQRFGFAYTDTDREFFDPSSTAPLTFDAFGRNERWEYQGTLELSDALHAVFGLESERSELSSASPTTFNPNPVPLASDVRLDSAYAQLSVSPIGALTFAVGLRYDDHETFGDSTTGRASLAWSAGPSTTLRASYGEGFKAPTLFHLFSEFGNPDLRPEQAESWDAGIEQRLLDDALVLSATYFNRDTNDMIDFVVCSDTSAPPCATQRFGYYDNVQKATADGVELGMLARLGDRLSLTANYTNMDVENTARGTANFGRSLPRRPGETANAQLSYAWPISLTTAVAVQHSGRSFDNASNSIVLDGYTLVDLRASYEVNAKLEVFGRLENVFDEDYETVNNYGTLGRAVFAGVRQSF